MRRKDPSKDFDGITFLFDRVLPWGEFVFETGNPMASKTMVNIEIAARLSRGLLHGDLFNKPRKVVYITVENDQRTALGPRFHAAEGDEDNFMHLEERFFMPSNIDRLEEIIKEVKPVLVVLDPIKDYFDHAVIYRQRDASDLLQKLADLAKKYRCTILGVAWARSNGRKGDQSVPGLREFTGKPRVVIAVGRIAKNEYVIGVSMGNNVKTYTGWVYSLEIVSLGKGRNKKEVTTGRVNWLREATEEDVMRAHEQIKIDDNDPALKEVLQFMNARDKSTNKMMEFETDVLTQWLTNARPMGIPKARKLLNSYRDAGYIERRPNDKAGADFRMLWSITDLGVLKLAPNEASKEYSMAKLFPPMREDQQRPALGTGKPTRRPTPERAS